MSREKALEHLINALDGEPIDTFGNRDMNGLDYYTDVKYVHDEVLAAYHELLKSESQELAGGSMSHSLRSRIL